jgi:hypothetical protein
MGCSRSAIYDDENEWHSFKIKAGLNNVNWGCYSTHAEYAKKGYKDFNLKGSLLRQFVLLLDTRDTLDRAEKAEQVEKQLYEKLKAKFEK